MPGYSGNDCGDVTPFDQWFGIRDQEYCRATDSFYFRGRAGHSTVLFNNSAWVYGGYDGEHVLSDFVEYSFLSNTFSEKKVQNSILLPPPTYSHTAAMWGSTMIVFGGVMASYMGPLQVLCL